MTRTAKIFMNGRSQAVRLPAEFRFEGDEVLIRKDPESGDIILSEKPKRPPNWDSFFAALKEADIPDDFLDKSNRLPDPLPKDPFEGWGK
jgi:antitoxin VapB